jgi:nicotinate dehydrogenase subunit B
MIERERYELRERPAYDFELGRRGFLRGLGGGVLVIGTVARATAQESGRGRRQGREMPQEMSAWLHIGEDGGITAYTGKAEVGQNTRTSLTQAVAEELRVPVSSVQLVMADTDRVPFDMGTFGSLSTPVMAPQLHRVAAAAREMLLEVAAKEWGVDPKTLEVRNSEVLEKTGTRRAGFGKLTRGQELVRTVGEDAPVTQASDWTVCGTPVAKANGREMVTGRHQFASDMSAPGMLFGKVLRPSAFGAQLQALDTKGAEALGGVVVVRDGEFAGVAAADPLKAEKALAALRAEWRTEMQPSSAELFAYLKANVTGSEPIHSAGSIDDGMRAGENKLRTTYQVAYIAHTPLEPRAALAEWKDGKLTVYTGSQRPFGVREELAQAFHMPEQKIRVIVPDTGSGYGGKHTGEAAIEAARLAKAAGKPVKVVWTREEEFTWAYARPAGVIEVASAAAKDGTITAWEYHNYNSGAAGIRGVYTIPNQKIVFHTTKSPLRQGSYRALAATANHFARESHMNELAHAAGFDPVEFRMKNLKDERQKAVIAAAAERFGWGKSRPSAGHGYGIAAGFEKNGYVASAAEVEVDRASGKVRVVRVVTAFDCGAVVNPDGLKNQIEGAVIMGLGGALFEALQFENGKLLNPHLRTYRVPRFSDVPALETVLMDRKDVRSAGAGESPIVALAPAVGEAIFSATGVRICSLPMAPTGVKT